MTDIETDGEAIYSDSDMSSDESMHTFMHTSDEDFIEVETEDETEDEFDDETENETEYESDDSVIEYKRQKIVSCEDEQKLEIKFKRKFDSNCNKCNRFK